MVFDIENWLWKSNFGTLSFLTPPYYTNLQNSIIFFGYVENSTNDNAILPWYFHLQSRSSKPSYSDGTTKIIDETNSTIAAWGAIICAILGCLGNVLTIYVLLRKKSLRKHSTTPFLLSLVGFSKPKPNPKGKVNKYPFHKSSNTF